MEPFRRFARAAWAVVAVNLLVVLWGAVVRATGSGAGCGSHWPLCNGEVVPQAPETATLVEFTHRLTSGVAGLLVIGLGVWAWRVFGAGHRVRRAALASVVFMLTEAALGAGLVLFGLVATDDSMARAGSLALHLVNTFLLLGALALTAWWATARADALPPAPARPLPSTPALLLALVGVLLVGMTGAVTALGDTLFPSGTLAEGLRADTSPTAHLLVRLRVLHPAFAAIVGTGVLMLAAAVRVRSAAGSRPHRLATAVGMAVILQWVAGIVNLLLLAPTGMQLVHLLLADLLWIALVLLAAEVLAPACAAAGVAPDAEAVPLRGAGTPLLSQ